MEKANDPVAVIVNGTYAQSVSIVAAPFEQLVKEKVTEPNVGATRIVCLYGNVNGNTFVPTPYPPIAIEFAGNT